MGYILYFWLRIARKTPWSNDIFTTLQSFFSKTLTRTLFTSTVTTEKDELSLIFLSVEVALPICSYWKHLYFNVNVALLALLRVPVSQNDCFIEAKSSLFRIHWVSVIALSRPHVNNHFRTLLRETKILGMFYHLL